MSDVRVAHVETGVHGRYLLRPPRSGGAPRGLLVGCHGYGEDAQAHLEALEGIPGVEAWRLVAVQALHPFYASRDGRVVASWMTSLDRLLAIQDNVAYLRRVVDAVREAEGSAGPLVYAGFSQGTAMAYRAAALSGHPVAAVIALAGDVPPELEEELGGLPRALLGRGRLDTWYTRKKLDRDVALLEGQGVAVEVCAFEGGHEWAAPFRERAGSFLESVVAA